MKKTNFLRIGFIIIIDILILCAAAGLAYLTRHDFRFSAFGTSPFRLWVKFFPMQVLITVAVFVLLRMYSLVWRSVGIWDMARVVLAVLLSNLISGVLQRFIRPDSFSTSVWLINTMYQLILFILERSSLRVLHFARRQLAQRGKASEHIMIIGAGEAGRVLLHEIAVSDKLRATACCVIDDNPEKHGRYLENVRIVGGRDQILPACEKYAIDRIILAMPSASAADRKKILDICQQSGCKVQSVPGVYQLMSGEISLTSVSNIQPEDLLGRDAIRLNPENIDRFLTGKTVMVTGGGGSIGSELCRQIARHRPGRLIILDIYENNAYDIQQELRRVWGDKLDLRVEIASVRDAEKIDILFARHRPQIVFHAAAHKHVPLMEDCPEEAIKNNVFGTYHVVTASEKYGVEKFVMISTDKAVNPTNLMGATKRLCEMILQSRPAGKTEFAAVRFGNVLGSNGSVVPLFRRQIENGGPVTITDKRIIRYFMTIPEAAQLVLDAGAMAKQNQVFVLDMGEPVKILTLAENMIRLSGYEPYTDIKIKEIGLRPGEKLYEELLIRSETLGKTENEKIFVEQQRPIESAQLDAALDSLRQLLNAGAESAEFIRRMHEIVPTYHTPEEVNAGV